MSIVSVVLVEDHQLVREALRFALAKESDIEVVGEAGDAAGALECARAHHPQVVVLDIGLPGITGIEVAARLVRLDPAPKVVALSAYAERRFVTEMLRAGANAYVTKSSAGTELVRAIRAVASGKSYFSPDVAEVVVSELRDEAPSPARLGAREREVLCLVARGLRSQHIAEQLNISVATVEVHRRNIMRKLELRSVAELTLYAVREGLVSL